MGVGDLCRPAERAKRVQLRAGEAGEGEAYDGDQDRARSNSISAGSAHDQMQTTAD
jgi:hypothetical protein